MVQGKQEITLGFSKHYWMLSKIPLTYMLTIFFVSSTIAFFIPVSSLFLTDELHVSKFNVGIFFTVQCLLMIFIGQAVAKYSDITGNRIQVIVFGCVCGILSCLSYAFIPNFWFILLFVNILFSFTGIGNQLFASAREFCESQGKNILTFTSLLRAFFASAWVIGPPIAMMLLDKYGFKSVYVSCAIVYLITIFLTLFFIPRNIKQVNKNEISKVKLFSDKSVIYLFLATMLIFTCNYMYLISMPQQVTKVLHFETKYVGIFMATAAACEVPCMLIFSQLAKKINMKYILLLAVLSGFVFYLIVGFAQTLTVFWVSQLANAIFIGNITTLGMHYFQELLPRVPGQATTLFTNAVAVGGIVSGLCCGTVAEFWGYPSVFVLASVLCIFAFIIIYLVRKVAND